MDNTAPEDTPMEPIDPHESSSNGLALDSPEIGKESPPSNGVQMEDTASAAEPEKQPDETRKEKGKAKQRDVDPTETKSGLSLVGGNWCLTVSDPGVFTGLLRGYGVKGLQAEELYTLEEGYLRDVGTIHGLIFLYKVPTDPRDFVVGETDLPPELFFANQVQNNACGTYAVMNIVMNLRGRPGVELGGLLEGYREFTEGFTPALKGETIANSPTLREIHNSFARPSDLLALRRQEFEAHPRYANLFEVVENASPRKAKKSKSKSKDEDEEEEEETFVLTDQDVFHYIVYVESKGIVWELDGLRRGPVEVGTLSQGENIDETSTGTARGKESNKQSLGWLDLVVPRLQKKMAAFEDKEITTSLLAIVPERLPRLQLRLRKLLLRRSELRKTLRLPEDGQDQEGLSMEIDAVEGQDDEIAIDTTGSAEEQIKQLEEKLEAARRDVNSEKETQDQQAQENVRRKHDYTPFVSSYFSKLIERGVLPGLNQESFDVPTDENIDSRANAFINAVGGDEDALKSLQHAIKHNNFLMEDAESWLQSLRLGQFEESYTELFEQWQREEEGVNLKDDEYEAWWGESGEKRKIAVAGASAALSLRDLIAANELRTGDTLIYARGLRGIDVRGSATITSITAKGTFTASLDVRNKTLTTKQMDSLSTLENAVLDLDGRLKRSERPNGNAWKSFERKRGAEVAGAMWEVRMKLWEKQQAERLDHDEDGDDVDDSVQEPPAKRRKSASKSRK
ncbi:cysteine proteinase [Gonapodya prolifera JEL478]|uniref:ubiquitinyl hydrolase 1 n=1 Tax=Gonapodya prolifera (strain JEL478) TaxID=1344416 RepID=A0A138ZXC4_GONPJ|nr:cysteine proteinase [Gonapodya prolifera JEL478]|eukprot:KXS09114.1 cysteine proteinase [Gonapodya prolifera JEL478]